MKKTLLLFLCMALLLALAGCSGAKTDTDGQSTGQTPEAAGSDASTTAPAAAIAEAGGADRPDSLFVEVRPQCPPAYGVSFRLPSDWTWEVAQTDDAPTSTVTVSIRPKAPGIEGEITFSCSDVFGVCGTGLEEEDITFNGLEARRGFFYGSPLWDFICLKGTGCAVINSAKNWYGEYEDVIGRILSTVEFLYYDGENAPDA